MPLCPRDRLRLLLRLSAVARRHPPSPRQRSCSSRLRPQQPSLATRHSMFLKRMERSTASPPAPRRLHRHRDRLPLRAPQCPPKQPLLRPRPLRSLHPPHHPHRPLPPTCHSMLSKCMKRCTARSPALRRFHRRWDRLTLPAPTAQCLLPGSSQRPLCLRSHAPQRPLPTAMKPPPRSTWPTRTGRCTASSPVWRAGRRLSPSTTPGWCTRRRATSSARGRRSRRRLRR
ncbi:hypothetical protein DFH09DRAFT_294053 [Mycena vulgaris]|nr:hypothetical protein DFH09DRAFT_294053 [Mycena vulgaris]